MKDFNGAKGKEKLTRENWRFLDKTEQQKIRDGFFNDKVTNKEWNKPQHKIGGRRAWQNADQKNIYYTKDGCHNDIEVWQVSGKKAEHLGSLEPVEGTMYKGPKHPQQVFE